MTTHTKSTVQLIPTREDNYSFWLKTPTQNILIDCGEAEPVLEALGDTKLDAVLLTHYHYDHIDGMPELLKHHNCKVYGSQIEIDLGRLKDMDVIGLTAGESIDLGTKIEVLHTPGHTQGHIAFYLPDEGTLFCGDTLFAGGCGRVFDGTMQELFASLRQINALPEDTNIYCGHEYTLQNMYFAAQQAPENEDILIRLAEVEKLRIQNKPTLPTTVELERKTNLFMQAALEEEFTELRKARNNF